MKRLIASASLLVALCACGEEDIAETNEQPYNTLPPVETPAETERPEGYMVGGVTWSPGNLDYDPATGNYFWADTPDMPGATARSVRGAHFKWMIPLPMNDADANRGVELDDYVNLTWFPAVPSWSGTEEISNSRYYNHFYEGDEIAVFTSGVLPAAIDAGTVGDPCWAMGKEWRMPTANEIYLLCKVMERAIPKRNELSKVSRLPEILNTCLADAETAYNIGTDEPAPANKYAGIYLSQSKSPNEVSAIPAADISGYKSAEHMFLPAAGYSKEGVIQEGSSHGYYWSSTPSGSSAKLSWGVSFSVDKFDTDMRTERYYGRSIRCVLRTSRE